MEPISFTDDVSRVISKYKELDFRSWQILWEVEEISYQMEFQKDHKTQSFNLQSLITEMHKLHNKKLELTNNINQLIIFKNDAFARKVCGFSDVESKLETSPAIIENAILTPVSIKKETRGRKPRSALSENNQDAHSNALLMLASVAEQESLKLSKPRVKKQKGNIRKQRKNKKTKNKRVTKSVKSDSESEKEIGKTTEVDENEPVYCLCSRISHGQMIECDNEACPLEWFHFNCVGLKRAPKGKW